MAQSEACPIHLDPSDLGTKEYWDSYYQNDLDDEDEDEDGDADPADPRELESWFDDVNAPAKILDFLTSERFPLSPTNRQSTGIHEPSVLDLGTGNGSMLFMLRQEAHFAGPMVGVDYSEQSIELARKLWSHYAAKIDQEGSTSNATAVAMRFEVADLIQDNICEAEWWPKEAGGFELVLDKGTFDAISLSSDTVADQSGNVRRICEVYPGRVAEMVVSGGYLLVTSCNWTEEEVVRWFTTGEGVEGRLKVFDTIKYPVYEFGGQKGQGVASVCFQKT